MKNTILIVALILGNVQIFSRQVEYIIQPTQTDTSITGNNAAHYCYFNNTVSSLNKLLIFFPGTNATPWDYRLFQQTAADLGYHVIGLSYENLESINMEVCPATRDSTCHRRARYEIWFGQDTHDSLEINYSNSVINRLLKLLKYLDNTYPLDNWGQYLVNDSTVNWGNIVTAGHSQGAGNATFGTKYFNVSRCIMFSWVDWMWPGKNPDWIKMSGVTPDSAYFGFIHTGDASIFNGIPTTWNNLGMMPYGQIISIDTAQFPYHNTHSLITGMPIDTIPTQVNYHNSTVVDWVTPIDDITRLPMLQPVWEYLLTLNPTTVSANDLAQNTFKIPCYPNPAENRLYFPTFFDKTGYTHQIYNSQGRNVYNKKDKSDLDISNLQRGFYLVVTSYQNRVFFTKIIKL